MQTYNCVVRLDGDVNREVPKYGVTAAEIQLLNALHRGNHPGVFKITKADVVERSTTEEYQRLASRYSSKDCAQLVTDIFGSAYSPRIPAELPPEIELEDANEEVTAHVAVATPKKRGRKKGWNKAKAPADNAEAVA